MPVSRQVTRNPGEGRGTIPKKVQKILITCLIVPICLFSLAQCGLEYLPYLTPPRSLTKSPTAFRVQKTVTNDAEFVVGEWEYQGIELYYKFYLPVSAGGGVPDSDKNYTQLSELAANGFHRVSRYTPPGDDDQTDKDKAILKPVLAVDTGMWPDDVDFSIDLANVEIKEEDIPTVMVEQIRRGVPYDFAETGKYPFFQRFTPPDDFDGSDADMDSALYAEKGSILMTMYALSYGKIDDLYDLHSDAVYLGAIDIDFGW